MPRQNAVRSVLRSASEALSLYAEARQLIEKYAGSKSAAAAIPTGLSAILRYDSGDISNAEVAVLDEPDLIVTTVFHESFLAGYLVLARAAQIMRCSATANAVISARNVWA